MQESTANEFYDRIVEGTDYEKKIEIEHTSGATLPGVKVSPVSKQMLAEVIQNLPEDMFDAVEEADSPDEAEEMLEEDSETSIEAMSSDTVEAFEMLCKKSLSHDELTQTRMNDIIENLDFGMLFELGGEIIDMSFAEGGAIKDFREQE